MLRKALFVVQEILSSRHCMVGCGRKNRLILNLTCRMEGRRGRCERNLRGECRGEEGGRAGRPAGEVVLTGPALAPFAKVDFVEHRLGFLGVTIRDEANANPNPTVTADW